MTTVTQQAHSNMVDNQIRGWDVVDMRVLDTLAAMPREAFVPPQWRAMAFADVPIPLGHGETMMKPVVEGRMLQALQLLPAEQVLEIGTGSGFITACLAHLAGHVTSLELRDDFAQRASTVLASQGLSNISLHTADAVTSWQPDRHFDAIVVTGAVAEIPAHWRDWLAPEGRMFVIHGRQPIMCASLLRNSPSGQIRRESLFDTSLPYLSHAGPRADYTV
ncbi:MAG: protein-L-isoaspartate O-methyltransferase [Rhodanobacteraceae bacterium]